jgi:hypothetical protein
MRRLPSVLALTLVLATCRPAPDQLSAEPPDRVAPLPSARPAPLPLPAAAPDLAPASPEEDNPPTLVEQRAALLRTMQRGLSLTDEQIDGVRGVIEGSPFIGQGNPALTQHPLSRAACRENRRSAGLGVTHHEVCGRDHMVPLYDPARGQTAADARVCIDQFEYPGIPCEYPVVYARSIEAAMLCRAVGKRLCDAHEWEGACAGALHDPEEEYAFDRDRLQGTYKHNTTREIVWSYGPERDSSTCGLDGGRSPKCTGVYGQCGSNTYPAGSFPACQSPLGVFDMQGNVAEHMNLPLAPDELARLGDGGSTEMKGSWFGFGRIVVHEDDCRWRAPDWHATKVLNPNSHRNYHLGFRCCLDVEG